MATRPTTPSNSGGEGQTISPAATLSRAGSSTSLRSRASKRLHTSTLNDSTVTLAGSELTCPVCFELLEEAHMTKCGHTFCYRCIAKSLETNGRCPKCSFAVGSVEHVFPNVLLNELVTKHKVSMAAATASASVGATKDEIDGALRDFVTLESQRMTLPDVNAVLELLTHRKQLLEAESCASQNRLLHEFLHNLLHRREDQLTRLRNEVAVIKRDIHEVENILKDVKEQAGKLPKLDDASPTETILKRDCPTLAARRKRMHAHFDDFVQCYFTTRIKDLIFVDKSVTGTAGVGGGGGGGEAVDEDVSNPSAVAPSSTMTTPNTSVMGGNNSSLDKFRESLVKFSRFETLKPLATLNYSSTMYSNSTIVSSIEFDRDDELFAIAGVTKRIKIYDYASVLRDSVDIHYPCMEIASSSKISCVSWNMYYKSLLATCDYEGCVALYDTSTGTKTKTFQEHEKRCWSVDFNNVDTRLFASGSDDSKVKLWSLNVEHSITSLEAKANVCCVKFKPSSSCHLAFGSADHCVHYYDLRSPKEPLLLFKGHKKAVSYVKFLNNDEIVSASTDSQLKMWSITKAQCLRSFVGHVNEKNFVGLATDGDYVACGSENNALYVYYKGLSKQLFSYRFDVARSIIEKSHKENDTNEFISAVCWKRNSNVVLAANSQGVIKVLELI